MLIRKPNAHIFLSGRTEKENIIIQSFLYETLRKGGFIQAAEE